MSQQGAADEIIAEAAERINRAHDELTLARRQLTRALVVRSKLIGRQPGICGTPAGYMRHRRQEEPPCWACGEAKAWQDRLGRGKKR